MGKVEKFEDLKVWQLSRELVNNVYDISNTWKDYSLKDQIRRASVSTLSNIAEGFERGTKSEFLHFLYISKGSCGEVRAQLYVAFDRKFISLPQFEKVYDKADHTSRMLSRFINGYKLKGHQGPKHLKAKNREREVFEEEIRSLVPTKYRMR